MGHSSRQLRRVLSHRDVQPGWRLRGPRLLAIWTTAVVAAIAARVAVIRSLAIAITVATGIGKDCASEPGQEQRRATSNQQGPRRLRRQNLVI